MLIGLIVITLEHISFLYRYINNFSQKSVEKTEKTVF